MRLQGGPALRIGIDYRPALDAQGGIAVYVRELVAALGRTFPDDRLELYGHRLRRPRGSGPVPIPANARLHRSRVPVRALTLAARAGLGADVLLGAADVVHWTDYVPLTTRQAPVVATVHDVCFATLPACYTPEQRTSLQAALEASVAHAARIIVPCARVSAELQHHAAVAAERIEVVAHGCRPMPDVPPATDLGRYVLFVGTLQPRKNVERLVRAFDAVHAAHPDVRLVLAGPRGWQDEAILSALAERAYVVHEPSADAARLSALYHGALAVALPSLGEGFGLPVLEAMHCGRAVLVGVDTACSDLAGDAGLPVDALDGDAIAAGLLRLVGDEALRTTLAARGRERAADYTWERTARATRAVYARARHA